MSASSSSASACGSERDPYAIAACDSDRDLYAAAACSSERALYAASVAKVAVAQIAQSVGIRTAQPSALRSLSDLAGRYLEALGKAAASAANSQGRTECNLWDVVLALEELASPRGFPGASTIRKPFLGSAVLRGIISYVDSVDEVPFALPIYCEGDLGVGNKLHYPSFALEGREPPPHVPVWLPVFPKSTEKKEKKKRIGENLWPENKGLELELDPEDRKVVRTEVRELQGGVLPSSRTRVRFKLSFHHEQVAEAGVIRCQMDGKDTPDCLPWRWENEEDGSRFISPAKELCRYEYNGQPLASLGVSSGFPD